MAQSTSLRAKLAGSWSLTSYYAYLPKDPSDVYYPMGPNATGIIMYTSDGYMSAQLCNPEPSSTSPQPYIAYTGAFYFDEVGDEKGPVLYHQMRDSNLPTLVGDVQRRLMKITDEDDGRYLTLAPDGPMVIGPDGLDRVLVVRWRRLDDNAKATSKPVKASSGGKL